MTKKCHFIGIGGIGMSGLARMMLESQAKVSGSDVASSSLIEELQKKGADVHIGHDPKYVTQDSTIVYSSMISQDNPEFRAAIEMKCPMLHRSDLLKALIGDNKLLGVTGTHGKTTTTALLAHVLIESGKAPSFAVGGIMPQLGVNAGRGAGEYFVAELDESDGSFTKFSSYGAIITSIGRDHMDYYGTTEKLTASFKQFAQQVQSSNHLFWCADNMYLRGLMPQGISFGFCESSALRASNFAQNGWNLSYDISYQGHTYPNVCLPLVGVHNALNSLAVFGLALSIGVDEQEIRRAFLSFRGVNRRCEKRGDAKNILIIDDYAHHPTEICSTLNAVREAIGERRLVVAFQPHRYTRIRDCLGEFGGVFDEADEVLVTDIYPAGEEPIPGVCSQNIVEENEQMSVVPFRMVSKGDLLPLLLQELHPGDVLITLGAGDITGISKELAEAIKKQP